ncbi:MAG: ABC transporter ATP-binding protein [Oscillospiraceae bacterium]|nr:ABC transporter ATP-binding protein [Oscillospiraceae bacterium]
MPPPRHGYQKPTNPVKALARVFSYMKGSTWRLLIVVCCLLVSSSAGIIGTYMLKPLINDHIVPAIGQNNPDLSAFLQALVFLGCVYLAGAVATYCTNRLMVTVSNSTLNAIRRDLFNHMQDLPISYFDTHTHGELMSRYTNDVDVVREMISGGLTNVITSSVSVVGTFTMMLILSPWLTLLVIAMLFVIFFVIKTIGGRSARAFKRQQAAVGAVNGYIEEMIEGQKVVKVFCHEPAVKEDFNKLNEEMRQAATMANTNANILMPIMGNLSYFNYAITAAVGAIMTINGMLDIGSIASFLQYTRSFFQPITQISQQFNNIFAALAGAERIFALIDSPPEEDDGYVTLVYAEKDADGNLIESDKRTGIWAWKHPHHDGTLTYTEVRGDVRFENMTFGYVPNKTVLHDLSLYAKPGQKIAFVGSTGAGKTTITNLLTRFYELNSGKIRYDGINIEKIKKDDLRRSMAMVLQDTHLFTGTVMENIRYGNLEASDEQVIAAAKLANAHNFIMHLPQGYDTVLTSDGANLSQGQRQLLAIARAAVADPPVLILDEATSSIDTRTESLISRGMDQLMAGRTVFVIAHRLSTVRNANAIMVLENGRIIERGDHDDLIAKGGKYYQLYTGMLELD